MPNKEKKEQDAKATKELIESLLEKLKPYFDTLMQHGKEERENINKVFNRLLLFLGLIIIAMSILAWKGVISGDALLFLIGTVVGYIMAFMLEMAKKSWFAK